VKRLVLSLATVLALAFAAAPAVAATEVGGTCVANDSVSDWTVIPVPGEADPLPIAVPADGVLTAWKLDVDAGAGPLEHTFQVFRSVAAEFVPVAESAPLSVVDGANVFPARIPVRAGDRFGLHGATETLFCDKTDVFNLAKFDGAIPLGAARAFDVNEGEGSPLRGVVEPDADGDGFGDESQDLCPASAAVVAPCPEVVLRAWAKPRRRAILVKVRVSSEARVKVYGQVRWRVRPKGKTPDGKPKKNVRLTQGLSGGRARSADPGTVKTFRVALPKTVKRRLSRLTKQQALRPELTVIATDVAGRETVRKLRTKLRGWR
jgi:hypothetical protein